MKKKKIIREEEIGGRGGERWREETTDKVKKHKGND